MSRLTHMPFHKPSPYDFPRPVHPLSPPETDADSLPPMNFISREPSSSVDLSSSAFTKVDPTENYTHGIPIDISTPKFRRPSSLGYLHSGSVRSESRVAPRSATRWLVTVIPPQVVAREHGNALFLSATRRTVQEVLMPLLPSLSGQMSAIAREFSFPSTSGIFVYLQITDGGVQSMPRVSDESWSILWGSAFEDKLPTASANGLPIAGRIEFDLDLRKARWFDSWVTACRRESDGLSISASVSMAHHRRNESHTTYSHDQPEDSLGDDVSVTIQQKIPVVRHVPRKLSLLDRFDVSTQQPLLQPQSQNVLLPRFTDRRTSLSPVENIEDEPQTAIQSVERKVQNWRASSSFATSPLVAVTGQTALDPTNMPNNLPLNESDTVPIDDNEGGQMLNLDDFTWSISSAGPPSLEGEPNSALFSDWDRVPSVHLAERLEGSVCLTPSTCTSFGPPDYDVTSPALSLIDRLPSPDLGSRCIDFAPLTPSTATSWGPSEWAESIASSSRAPSVDIAARHIHSRPVTPSTATSWGAPLDWPASPSTPDYILTPDIGQMFLDEDDIDSSRNASVPVTSSLPNGQQPWRYVWPYIGSAGVYDTPLPWKHVWPYIGLRSEEDIVATTSYENPCYPWFNLYPAVYPYFDLYPIKPETFGEVKQVKVTLNVDYPNICIYSSVYPTFEIYPGNVVPPQVPFKKASPVKLDTNYPHLEIYPPVYPHFVIYPPVPATGVFPTGESASAPSIIDFSCLSTSQYLPLSHNIRTKLPIDYPVFDLYPAVYPSNLEEIYPRIQIENENDIFLPVDLKLPVAYPYFDLYPARYPHLELYPRSVPELERRSGSDVFPDVLRMLDNALETKKQIDVTLRPAYPQFDLYPPVYPNICIYPDCSPTPKEPATIHCDCHYPNFDLYPAIYPYFDIYRSGKAVMIEYWREPCSVRVESQYPHINIYPAVYPYFDVFGSGVARTPVFWRDAKSINASSQYPRFNLYPAVYPYFDIYNSGIATTPEYWRDPRPVQTETKYPHIIPYPPVYPYFQLYPTQQSIECGVPAGLKSSYDEPHSTCMTLSNCYEGADDARNLSAKERPRRTHAQLHHEVLAETSLRAISNSHRMDSQKDDISSSSLSQSVGYSRLPTRHSQRPTSMHRVATHLPEITGNIARSASLQQPRHPQRLPIENEHIERQRPNASQGLEGIQGDGSHLRRKTRRDSIILEKARHWGVSSSQSNSSKHLMDELSNFPLPPRPPPPMSMPVASDLNRPIAKLDRSKLPFH